MKNKRYKSIVENGRKIRVHRYVMEKHIGRPLKYNEHVYHINGDPHDNQIENLIIIEKNME